MSVTQPTQAARVVPRKFSQYVAGLEPVEKAICTGCRANPSLASDGANDYCEPCLRYMHGYDEAEESTARMIIAAAIVGALRSGVSEEIVRAGVEDAFRGRLDVIE